MKKAFINLINILLFFSFICFLLFGEFSQSESIQTLDNLNSTINQENLRGYDFIYLLNSDISEGFTNMGFWFLTLITINALALLIVLILKNKKTKNKILVLLITLSFIPIFKLSQYPAIYQAISESTFQSESISTKSETSGTIIQIIISIIILSFNLFIKQKTNFNLKDSNLIDTQ